MIADKPTPAYVISSSIMPAGHPATDEYVAAVRPLLAKAGAEALVVGRAGQIDTVLEGDWPTDGALTIIRFPSMQALQAFWYSDEYQAIKHLRTDNIEPNFSVAVSGLADNIG